MTDGNRAQSEPNSSASQPVGEGGSLHDRVQTLRERASKLSETLDGVEMSLREAAGEAKE